MERLEERKVKKVMVVEDHQEHEMCTMCGDESLQYLDEDVVEICPFCYDYDGN